VEHFGYTVTDGIADVASTLDVTINAGAGSTNHAPIVASPLADQDLTFNKAFSFKLPANSFIDPDQGDKLSYSATLADGSALPTWLKFDAATGTFSGSTPKQVGSIDVRVTATDQAKANVSDVFSLSVSHGNEGVGNGQDAAPAGHDTSFNDGPGTGPGNPGAKGGKVATPAKAANAVDIAAAPAIAAPAAPAAAAPAAPAAPDARATPAVPAYLNASQLSQFTTPASNIGNTDSSQAFGNWLAVDLAVSQTTADKKSKSLAGESSAADTSGLSKATTGLLGSTASIVADPLAHAAGAGQELQVFGGLGKGVAKIK
jgi:hypothetical protein